MEGGATRGGVTGGVTHAMSGGGGEVQQWWRVEVCCPLPRYERYSKAAGTQVQYGVCPL